MNAVVRTFGSVLCLALLAWRAGALEIRITVRGGETDAIDTPISAPVKLPWSLARAKPDRIKVRVRELASMSRRGLSGQIVPHGKGATRLCFIAPRVAARRSVTWTARVSERRGSAAEGFSWKDQRGEFLDLLLGRKPVARYMYGRDTSTPRRAHETYKVFHQIYDEAGKGFITKGAHGKYTHHRGVYIGWSKIGFGGKRYDLWHMKPKAVQLHRAFAEPFVAGPVLGRAVSTIEWKTSDEGTVILEERRETTFFRQEKPGMVLLDLSSTVKAVAGEVELNGDPEHAGFQFRPSNAISGTAEDGRKKVPLGNNRKARYLFHADGVNPKKVKDLPWVAMNYALDGKPYSVLYIRHPDNPKGAVYSAYRDYGRFGSWLRWKLNSGESLTLQYRLWVAASDMPSRAECAARAAALISPPTLRVLQ